MKTDSALQENLIVADDQVRSNAGRPGVFVKTFGCQMNEYDSEKMLSLLSSSFRPVTAVEDAALVLVNTCSVREKGEQKLRSLLGQLRDVKRDRPELIIGVGGCVAQQEGQHIVKQNPAVDFVVGTHNLSLIPSLVQGVQAGKRGQVAIDYRDEWEDLPDAFIPFADDEDGEKVAASSVLPTPVRALVAIQRGCNKNCTFCVVPNTRGPEFSRDPDEIVREAALKVRFGAKEVLLLGQTVNSYGRDLNPRVPFEKLIERLAAIEGLKRIRFTSPHPQEVRPGFIALYKDVPELCPHIHLPLQSGSDRILKLMNRNYRTRRYLEIVNSLREACLGIAITSDIIVGFPTETEADFQLTLDMMTQVQYNSSYSFKYSRRPNTKALRVFGEQDEVLDGVAKERLARLQAYQDDMSLKLNRRLMDSVVEVLVEGPGKKISSLMRGRNLHNVPVEITGGKPGLGEEVGVVIEHAGVHGLRGRLLNH